jgi:hypothetical protein
MTSDSPMRIKSSSLAGAWSRTALQISLAGFACIPELSFGSLAFPSHPHRHRLRPYQGKGCHPKFIRLISSRSVEVIHGQVLSCVQARLANNSLTSCGTSETGDSSYSPSAAAPELKNRTPRSSGSIVLRCRLSPAYGLPGTSATRPCPSLYPPSFKTGHNSGCADIKGQRERRRHT